MTKLVSLPDVAKHMERYHGIADDFQSYVTLHDWTTVASNSGTVIAGDGLDTGVVLTPADGTVADNDETYMHGANENFKFAADKPLHFCALISFTEVTANISNVIVGLKDAVAADSILDDGAGPAASYSGAVFFKADGDTVWSVENSITTTQKTTQLTADNSLDGTAKTAVAGTQYKLEIISDPVSATDNRFTFKINDVHVARHIGQTTASATDMQICFGVKLGADTNNDTLSAHYCYCYQLR